MMGYISGNGSSLTASESLSGSRVQVTTPVGFTYTNYGFNIYRRPNSRFFETDLTVSRPAYTDYYVDPVNGSNANPGTSINAPKQNIANLVANLNAGSAVSARINLATGVYTELQVMGAAAPTFDLALIGNGSILINGVTPAWTKTAGKTNVYEFTKSTGGAPGGIIDLTQLDKYPDAIGTFRPLPYLYVADTTACDATPGSYTIVSTTIYLHAWDNRVADTNIYILCTDNKAVTNNKNVYVENVKFWGGGNAFQCVGNANKTNYFINCDFGYSTGNCFGAQVETGTKIYHVNGRCYYAGLDGYNYHCLTTTCGEIVELNCTSYANGHGIYGTAGTGANNDSTCHDGGHVISINCNFGGSGNRPMADVNANTQRWALGTTVGPAYLQTDPVNSNCIQLGNASTETRSARCTWWLDTCNILGGTQMDVIVLSNCTLNLHNTDLSKLKLAITGSLGSY